jgi:hypothetical protein
MKAKTMTNEQLLYFLDNFNGVSLLVGFLILFTCFLVFLKIRIHYLKKKGV